MSNFSNLLKETFKRDIEKIESIKETSNRDKEKIEPENENNDSNNAFKILDYHTPYIIESHLIYKMKSLIDENKFNDKYISDDKYLLKFDCLASIIIKRFISFYNRIQILSIEMNDDFIELQDKIRDIYYGYSIDKRILREYFKSLNDYYDYDFKYSYAIYDYLSKKEISYIFKDIEFVNRKNHKEVYSLLQDFLIILNLDLVIEKHNLDLKKMKNKYILETYISNLSFYICLTKKSTIEFLKRIKAIIDDKIMKLICKVYDDESNCSKKIFNTLCKYLNVKHHRNYGILRESDKKGKCQGCFSIMQSSMYNYFALSGEDGKKLKGIQSIGYKINNQIFGDSYIYSFLTTNTKRYVSLHKKNDSFYLLHNPIELRFDNEIRLSKIENIGSAYGCCERKILDFYYQNEHNNNNNKLTFYIKYLPCEKCSPAFSDLNATVYSLFNDYDDMLKQITNDNKLLIKKAVITNKFVFSN